MPDSPIPESSPGPSDEDLPLDQLDQELDRVKAELEEYQELIEELPSIYEGKFQNQLRDVAQDIRRLLDERQGLQQQIDRALQGAPAGPDHELPGSEPEPSGGGSPSRSRPLPLVVLSALTALAVAGGVAAFGLWNRARTPQIAAHEQSDVKASGSAPQPPADQPERQPQEGPQLRLRFNGECWIEVQTLAGEMVLVNTFQEGDTYSLPLDRGLRLLVGRPDLLDLAVGESGFRRFGPIERIDWVVIRPPEDPEGSS